MPLAKGEVLVTTHKSGAPVQVPQALSAPSHFGFVKAIGVHARDVETTRRGITERLFGVVVNGQLVPVPKPTISVHHTLRGFKRRFVRRMGRPSCESRQSFVDTYTGRKRTIYQTAADSLTVRPVERSDAYLKAFVKVEKTDFSLRDDGSLPVPRVIQPRNPRYNVEVGRRLKFMEHRAYSAIGKVFGGTTVHKGLNPDQRASLLHKNYMATPGCVMMGLDAERLDQHISVPVLEWEHGVYNSLFRDPDLQRLLKWQLVNKGRAYCRDGVVRYVKKGTRGSGDMNTSLGNCLIMCAMVWTYARHRGCKILLANDGDDCVVFLRGDDHARFSHGLQDWFLQLGFKMKIDYTTKEFEKIVFCKSSPVNVDGTWKMVRGPIKALGGDLFSTKVNNDKSLRSHLGAVGVCGGVLSTGVPVFQAFYEAMRRNGDETKAIKMLSTDVELLGYGFTRMAHMLSPTFAYSVKPITTASRVSFWRAFGITPDQQVILERHYSKVLVGKLTPLRLEISHFQYTVRRPAVPNCFLTQYG